MAIDDLDTLRTGLPDLFEDIPLPPGWEDNWIIMSVDKPEGAGLTELETAFERELLEFEAPPMNECLNIMPGLREDGPLRIAGFEPTVSLPEFGEDTVFPGIPLAKKKWGSSAYPPPDAFAFYLPFHFFHPVWWGVYLTVEGTEWLAGLIWRNADGVISRNEAMLAARHFLYFHEAFHHSTECFATRLEVTHRVPLYREGCSNLYEKSSGTDECQEEALANAYALLRVREVTFKKDKHKKDAVLRVLEAYVRGGPPGYRQGVKYKTKTAFKNQRNAFAEENQTWCLPDIPGANRGIWDTFPQAFTGISRVTSRANYIISKDCPLAVRRGLHLRYLTYADLTKKLVKLAGAKKVDSGKGSHEKWETPLGKRFVVPRHPGDLAKGTLAKIIKQAGLKMSLSEFLAEAI